MTPVYIGWTISFITWLVMVILWGISIKHKDNLLSVLFLSMEITALGFMWIFRGFMNGWW